MTEPTITLFQLPLTAMQLSDAGVKFMVSESLNPLNNTFSKRNGELQCHYYGKQPSSFTDLVLFLCSLISNVIDIQILQKTGILVNQIGSDETLLNLFNGLDNNLSLFSYPTVSQEVNAYANRPWNKSMAIGGSTILTNK